MTTTDATLESVQIGQPQTYQESATRDGNQRQWRSAIVKSSIVGPANVNETGLEGDVQADRQSHGGIDKAVLAYAASHYQLWRSELPAVDWRPGGFGENLTIVGLDETTVCLGDHYRIGEVLFEVSQPRQPCWKLSRIWKQPDLTKRVVVSGRSGWYLRVRETGAIEPGQAVLLVDRPLPEWSVDRANQLMYGQVHDQQAVETLARLPQLSLAWREDLISRRML
jgi:MOSC domain-containing protein YiiM